MSLRGVAVQSMRVSLRMSILREFLACLFLPPPSEEPPVAELAWLLVAQQDHSAACARDLILKLLRDPLHTSLLQLGEILTLIDLLIFRGSCARTPPPAQQVLARGKRFRS